MSFPKAVLPCLLMVTLCRVCLPGLLSSRAEVTPQPNLEQGQPVIVANPTGQTVTLGDTAVFTVTAEGPAPLAYQWFKNGTRLAGETLPSLRLSPVTTASAGTYSVRVSNPAGSVFSPQAELTVAFPATPVILVETRSQSVTEGDRVALEITAEGAGFLSYRWFKDGTQLFGRNTPFLAFNAITQADAGTYRVEVSNAGGTVSSTAVLTVAPRLPPTFALHPTPTQAEPGADVAFVGRATTSTGQAPSYQWMRNGTPIPGATRAILHLTNITSAAEATYSLRAAAGGASTFSQGATLTVTDPGPARDLVPGDLVNVDFGTRPASAKSGPAALGFGPGDFWNAYERRSLDGTLVEHGAVPNLRTTSGAVTPARLKVSNAGGADTSGVPDPMFDSHLYSVTSATAMAEIEGLSGGHYDLLLYGHGGPATDLANTVFEIHVDGIVLGAKATTTGPGWSSPQWVEGDQYVAFRALPVPTGSTVRILALAGADGRGYLNGLQLLRTDPPTPPEPPRITQSPAPTTVFVGDLARFEVTASGTPPLSYRWTHDGRVLVSADGPVLHIAAAQAADTGRYQVEVSNAAGTASSEPVLLTVLDRPIPPTLLLQPIAVQALEGGTATFRVDASGTAPLTYLWSKNGTPLPGATGPELVLTNVAMADAGEYSAEVRNAVGSIHSTGALLTVSPRPSEGATILFANRVAGGLDAPVHAADGTLLAGPGYLAQLFAGTNDTPDSMIPVGPAVPFQSGPGSGYWETATGTTRILPFLQPGDPAFVQIRAWRTDDGSDHETALANRGEVGESKVLRVVTGGSGLPPAKPAVLDTLQPFTVQRAGPPQLLAEPPIQGPVLIGNPIHLAVRASGPMLSYQWYRDGLALPGATTPDLHLDHSALGDTGHYVLVVNNRLGSVVTSPVHVEVVWSRLFRLGAGIPLVEGTREPMGLRLQNSEPVTSATLRITYDPDVLTDPQVEWTGLPAGTTASVDPTKPGELRLAFDTSPAGTPFTPGEREVASLRFRARSVAAERTTPLGLTVDSLDGGGGSTVPPGSLAMGAEARITPRSRTADNNGNHRLDIGDANIILRWLAGLEPARPWDTPGNDLNGNATLDRGDAELVLRSTVGPPAAAPALPSLDSPGRPRLQSPSPGPAATPPLHLQVLPPTAPPGALVRVQVRVANTTAATAPLTGLSFALLYDPQALRLESLAGLIPGDALPPTALTAWNLASDLDLPRQDGRLRFAAASALPWTPGDGLVASVILRVQAGATSRNPWRIQTEAGEATSDGYVLESLSPTESTFVAREPLPTNLDRPGRGPDGSWEFRITGEPGARFRIETSSDLLTWGPVGEVSTDGSGVAGYRESPDNAPAAARFYRVSRAE